MKHKCDVCKQPILDGDGVLHGFEQDRTGFAFWKWTDEASEFNPMGHVHKRCIGAQVQAYLTRYEWGRLELPGAHVVITRKKMANRTR